MGLNTIVAVCSFNPTIIRIFSHNSTIIAVLSFIRRNTFAKMFLRNSNLKYSSSTPQVKEMFKHPLRLEQNDCSYRSFLNVNVSRKWDTKSIKTAIMGKSWSILMCPIVVQLFIWLSFIISLLSLDKSQFCLKSTFTKISPFPKSFWEWWKFLTMSLPLMDSITPSPKNFQLFYEWYYWKLYHNIFVIWSGKWQ